MITLEKISEGATSPEIFFRVGYITLLIDIILSLSPKTNSQEPILETLKNASVQDLIFVFIVLILIKSYKTSIYSAPYLVFLLQQKIFERDISVSEFRGFFFNLEAFTTNPELQKYGNVRQNFYISSFYYLIAMIFLDDLTIYSVATTVDRLAEGYFSFGSFKVAGIEIGNQLFVIIAMAVFLFSTSFYQVYIAFHKIYEEKYKSETKELKERTIESQISRAVNAQTDIAYIEAIKLKAQLRHLSLLLQRNRRKIRRTKVKRR